MVITFRIRPFGVGREEAGLGGGSHTEAEKSAGLQAMSQSRETSGTPLDYQGHQDLRSQERDDGGPAK